MALWATPPHAARGAAVIHDEDRRPVGLAALGEDRLPLRLGAAEHAGDEAAGVVAGRPGAARLPARLGRLLDLRIAAARQNFGAADQDAGIDAERPADQAEHDDGADAEPAAADRETEPPPPPPDSPRRSSMLLLFSRSSKRIDPLHRAAPANPPGTVRSRSYHRAGRLRTMQGTLNMVLAKVTAPVRRAGRLSRFLLCSVMIRIVGCRSRVTDRVTSVQSSESWSCRVAGRPLGRPARFSPADPLTRS